MKVDQQKLTEILANKSGLEPESVKNQLDELVARIKSAAEKGKALEIKGFGMFYFRENSELTFDPSDDLQTEINYKYAGMEPVEIKKPFEAPEKSVREKESDSAEDQIPDQISGLNADESSSPEPEKTEWPVESENEKTGSTESRDKNKDSEQIKSGLKNRDDSGMSKKHGNRAIRNRGPKKRENSVTIVMTAIVVILAVISVLILVLDREFMGNIFNSGRVQEVTQMNPEQEETDPAADEDASVPGAEETSDSLLADSDADTETETAAGWPDREQPLPPAIEEVDLSGQPANEPYGLYGTAGTVEDPYYSIILHSIRGEDRAEEIREELQNEGYRTVITSVNHEEMGLMWRVGLGQFESIPDAQNAAADLPKTYRDNNFIGIVR